MLFEGVLCSACLCIVINKVSGHRSGLWVFGLQLKIMAPHSCLQISAPSISFFCHFTFLTYLLFSFTRSSGFVCRYHAGLRHADSPRNQKAYTSISPALFPSKYFAIYGSRSVHLRPNLHPDPVSRLRSGLRMILLCHR